MKKLENLSKFRQLRSLGRIADSVLQREWIANAANWSIQKSGAAELRNKQQLSLHVGIVIAYHIALYFIIQKHRWLN